MDKELHKKINEIAEGKVGITVKIGKNYIIKNIKGKSILEYHSHNGKILIYKLKPIMKLLSQKDQINFNENYIRRRRPPQLYENCSFYQGDRGVQQSAKESRQACPYGSASSCRQ